jgi:hypothetical protein
MGGRRNRPSGSGAAASVAATAAKLAAAAVVSGGAPTAPAGEASSSSLMAQQPSAAACVIGRSSARRLSRACIGQEPSRQQAMRASGFGCQPVHRPMFPIDTCSARRSTDRGPKGRVTPRLMSTALGCVKGARPGTFRVQQGQQAPAESPRSWRSRLLCNGPSANAQWPTLRSAWAQKRAQFPRPLRSPPLLTFGGQRRPQSFRRLPGQNWTLVISRIDARGFTQSPLASMPRTYI